MSDRTNELVFAPLGGVGEIGMNLSLYGFGPPRKRAWIAVDLGVAFAGDDLPGIDLIMPDIRFLVQQKRDLRALVLTHAHEDHFGALIDLWPQFRAPVYATPFTAATSGLASRTTRTQLSSSHSSSLPAARESRRALN